MTIHKNQWSLFLALLGLTVFTAQPAQAQDGGAPLLEPVWVTQGEFENPSSVVISRRHKAIFVANEAGSSPGKTGFVSRLSRDGTIEQLKWFEDLQAPTGLAVGGDSLWVADVNRLVEIDISSGRYVGQYLLADSGVSRVRDVTVHQEQVYAIGPGVIYELLYRGFAEVIRDDDLLANPTGIHAIRGGFFVAADQLLQISYSGRTKKTLGDPAIIRDLSGGISGGSSGLIVSLKGDRPAYELRDDGTDVPLFRGAPFVRDTYIDSYLLVAVTGEQQIAGYDLQPHFTGSAARPTAAKAAPAGQTAQFAAIGRRFSISKTMPPDVARIAKLLDDPKARHPAVRQDVQRGILLHQNRLPPLYLFDLAELTYDDDPDAAVRWYVLGRIRARLDAVLCADRTARQGVNYLSARAPRTAAYARENPELVASIGLELLAGGDIYASQASPWWICAHGAAATSSALLNALSPDARAEMGLSPTEERPWLIPEADMAAAYKQVLESLRASMTEMKPQREERR